MQFLPLILEDASEWEKLNILIKFIVEPGLKLWLTVPFSIEHSVYPVMVFDPLIKSRY